MSGINSRISYSSAPSQMDEGMISRVMNRGIGGAMAGGAVGAAAGVWVFGIGALAGAGLGSLLGAVGGIASGLHSSDAEKTRNRPIQVDDPLGGRTTVYVSAEQWKGIKADMAKGFKFDEFPSPLDQQFQAANPPAQVNR